MTSRLGIRRARLIEDAAPPETSQGAYLAGVQDATMMPSTPAVTQSAASPR